MIKKYKLVPVELIDRFPEINPSNYDHDDACALNAWGVELVLAAVDAPAVQGEPVAWRYRMFSEDWEKIATIHPSTFHPDHKDLIIEPLYTAPQPAPDAALLEAFDAGRRAAQAEAAELAGALDEMIKAADVASWGGHFPTDAVTRAVEALAAYRKQGGDT